MAYIKQKDTKPLGRSLAVKGKVKVKTVKKPAKTTQSKVSPESVYATGKRKEAIARVWIHKGNGAFSVNGQSMNAYFKHNVLRMLINQPFSATQTSAQYDVFCTVKGSGVSGQAGAIRHGISKALNLANPALHKILREQGFLTRDSRTVERKKYGRPKARKNFQFSKR